MSISKKCELCCAEYSVADSIVGRGRRFCSSTCSSASRRGRPAHNRKDPVAVTCGMCGKQETKWPARAATYRFCSRACLAAHKRTVTGANHPLYKGLAERTCEWCSATFFCKPAKVTYGEGRFCSRQCLGSATSFAQQGRRSSIEITTEAWLAERQVEMHAQVQIGPWLADFYLPGHHLVVECDGDYWHAKPRSIARDKQKNWWMHANGYRIVRLSETAIKAADFSALEAALA